MDSSDETSSTTAATFWLAIRQGNDYFNEGRYESAIQHYIPAWNIDYTSAIINSNLASACFHLEQYMVGEICGMLAFMYRGEWETGYIKSVICALGAGKVETALKRIQSCMKHCVIRSADVIILNQLVEYYAVGKGKGKPFPLDHDVIKRLCNVDFKVDLDVLGPDTSVEHMFSHSKSTKELLLKAKGILDTIFMDCRLVVPCDLMPIIEKCAEDGTYDLAPRSVDEAADLTTVETSQPVKKDTLGDLEKRLLQQNQNEKCKSLLNPTVEPLVQVFTKYFPKFVSSKPPETLKTNISDLKPIVTPFAADCKSLPTFGPNESVQMITTIDISEFKPALAIDRKKLPQKSNKPRKPSAERNKRTGEIAIRKGPITSEDINSDLLLRLAEEDTTSQVRKRQPVIQRSEDVLRYLHAGVSCLFEDHPCMALNHFKHAKQIMSEGQIDVNAIKCDVTLVKYLLNLAGVQSKIYENVVTAVHCLRELEPCTIKLPAIYYLLGCAYCVLNRFKNAVEPLVKCEELLEMHVPFPSHKWPGKELVIKETTREGLQESIAELMQRCRVSHKPTAVCRYNNCLTIGTHIIPSENIFSNDLDFIGFVRLICEEKCRIEFHMNCWKSFKDKVSDIIKITDKEILGSPCLTADCVTENGNQSIIVTMEVIGENGNLKTRKKLEPSTNKATDGAQTKNSRKKKNKGMEENMKMFHLQSLKMVKQKYRKMHSYEDDTTFEESVNNNSSIVTTVGGRIQGTTLSDKLHFNLPALPDVPACSVPSAPDTSTSNETLNDEAPVCNMPSLALLNESNVLMFNDDNPLVTPAELTCSVSTTLPDESVCNLSITLPDGAAVSATLTDESSSSVPSTTLPVVSAAGNVPIIWPDELFHSVPGISSCNVHKTDNIQCRCDSNKCINTVTEDVGFIVKTFENGDFFRTGIYFSDSKDNHIMVPNTLTQTVETVNVEGVEDGGTEEQKQADDENKQEINWLASENESNGVVKFEENTHTLINAAEVVNLPCFRICDNDSTNVTSNMVTCAYTNHSSSSDYNDVKKKKKTCKRRSDTSPAGMQLVDSSVQSHHPKMPEDESTLTVLVHDAQTGECEPHKITVEDVYQWLQDNTESQIAAASVSSYTYTSQDVHPTQATLMQSGVVQLSGQAAMVSHQDSQQQLQQICSTDQINVLQASTQNTAAANFFPQNTVFFETMSDVEKTEQRGILPQPQLFRHMRYFDQYMQNNGHNFVYSPQQSSCVITGCVDLFCNQYALPTNNYEQLSNYFLQASGYCNNGNISSTVLENLGNQVVPFVEGRQQKRIQWIDGHSASGVQQHYNPYMRNTSGQNISVRRGVTETLQFHEVEETFLEQVNNQIEQNVSVHSTCTQTEVHCESEQKISLQLVNGQETQAPCDDEQKLLQGQQVNAEADLQKASAQNSDQQPVTCNRDENLVENQTDASIASQDFEENSNDMLSKFMSCMQAFIYKFADMKTTWSEMVKLVSLVQFDDVHRIFLTEIQRAPHKDAVNIVEVLEAFADLNFEEMKNALSQSYEKRLQTQYVSKVLDKFLTHLKRIYSREQRNLNQDVASEAEFGDTINELVECVEREYEKQLKKVVEEYKAERQNLINNAERLNRQVQHLTNKSEAVAREIQRKLEIQERVIKEQKAKIHNCIMSDCAFREQIYNSNLKLAVQRCFSNIDHLNQLLNGGIQGVKEMPCWKIVDAKIDEWNKYFKFYSKLEQEYKKTFKKCRNKITSGQEVTLPSTDLTDMPPEPTPLAFSKILSEILDYEDNMSSEILDYEDNMSSVPRGTCRHHNLPYRHHNLSCRHHHLPCRHHNLSCRHRNLSTPDKVNEVCVRKCNHIQKDSCDHKKTEEDDRHVVPASAPPAELSSVDLQYYNTNILSIPKIPLRCSCGNAFEIVLNESICPPYDKKNPYMNLSQEEKVTLLKVLPYLYRMISEAPTIPRLSLMRESVVVPPAGVSEDSVPQKLSKAERKAAKRNKKVKRNEEEGNVIQHITRGAKENRSAVQQQKNDYKFIEPSRTNSTKQNAAKQMVQTAADVVVEETTEKNNKELLTMEPCEKCIRHMQQMQSLSEHNIQEHISDKLTSATSSHVKSAAAASNDRFKAAAPSLESVLSEKAAVSTEALNTQEPPVTMEQTKKKRRKNRKRKNLKSRLVQSEMPELSPFYPSSVTEMASQVSEDEQSLPVHDEEESTPQMYIDKSEEKEEEWSTVKKKVPSKTNVVVPVPAEPRVKTFKTMLLNRLHKKYESKSVKELEDAIKLVRDQNSGSMSGLPIDEIVARIDHMFHERNLRKQSTMGLEKFKSNPWGKVKNEKPNCSWSGILLECAICLEPMKEDQTVLPCNHSFDTFCIRQWLREQSVCPLCKIFATMPDEFPAL